MVERYQRLSPLADLHLDAVPPTPEADAAVHMVETPTFGLLSLRGSKDAKAFTAAVGKALGLVLPAKVGATTTLRDLTVICRGPDEWLLLTAEDAEQALEAKLQNALASVHHAVVDITHAWALIDLSGLDARSVLAKGSALDLHPRAWPPGHAATTVLAKADVTLWLAEESQAEGPRFRILCRRSFAEYLWTWLEDAASEYRSAATGGAV